MIEIHLSQSRESASDHNAANALGRYFRCMPVCSGAHADLPRLHLTSQRLPEPFRVYPDRGVVVSTWESAAICTYTGIRIDRYVLIASLLALSQWRVLRKNPFLRLEDLQHPAGVHCVFAAPHSVQDFALLLDPPVICPGCVDFYHCLGVDSELLALREVIVETQIASASGDLVG